MLDIPPSTPPRRRWLRLAVLVLLLWLGWEIVCVLLTGNHHVVIPGRLYRGAQPSPASLETMVRKLGIRTVINVRGCCYNDDWFVAEAAACQRLGIQLEDLSFSAMHLPSRDELRQLVEVLDRAEYPVFVHCRQGADRTGMASVIARLLQDDQPYEGARRELGLRFGHAPLGRTTVLDRFFSLYEDWLAQKGQTHRPQLLRQWLAEGYRGGWCDARFEKVERLFDAPRVGQSLSYRIVVRNTTSAPWRLQPLKTAGVHVTFKVMDEREAMIYEGRAGMLDQVVAPGEKAQVVMVVPPIWIKGKYRLYVDMIEEGHCWFHQTGSELWEEELAVRE